MEFIDAKEITTYFTNIVNEWADGYKDINLEELSESDKKVASTLAYFMLRTVTMIHEFPTVEAELVKHGHWVKSSEYKGDDTSGYIDNHWTCSECGKEAIVNEWYMYDLTDYCPSCGTKMDEVING